MRESKRQILGSLAALALLLLAVPALADVTNGDFENGGSDWIEFGDPGLLASYPPDGGVDGGAYARLESDFENQGGFFCITQTFQCGDPTIGTECTIGFDYRLTRGDAALGTGRIIVVIDGVIDIVTDVENSDWLFVSYVVPCGEHEIQICLEVDPENNNWVACIDNVRAECTGIVPSELGSWGSLKTLYR